LTRRRAVEGDALAEAEALAKEAAALRAEAAQLQEAEASQKRDARARQILGPVLETVDREGLEGWLRERQGLEAAAASEGAERLAAACAGREVLELKDLSSSAFNAELEKVLQEAREATANAAALAQREQMLRAKQAREEKDSLSREERRPWKPEQLNDDRDPGTRLVSALAYLFPLLDSLYGVALAAESEQIPVLSSIISALSPFFFLLGQFSLGTQILWFLLTVVANNRRLPRLLRFSIQQAVFLDVAYLALALVASAAYFGTGGPGDDVSVSFVLPIFALMSLIFLYAAVSALLLGREADSLPFLSKYTSDWIDGPPPPGFGSGDD